MKEILSDRGFKLMTFVMKTMDAVYSIPEKKAKTLGVKEGMTVVDYGCGPGRYTLPFSQMVGKQGKVFAIDLSPISKNMIEEKIKKHNLNNVQFSLAKGYNSNLNDEVADMIVALDMFHMIEKPVDFLNELNRICKKDGILVIDDGHQSRKTTKKKLVDSGLWLIIEERKDVLKCKKV